MRKIILYMFTTLDGFVAGPNGEFDDYEPSLEEHTFANELFGSMDGVLFGRITYEGFIGYWDTLDLNDSHVPAVEKEFATIFRQMQRVVFSTTLDTVDAKAILIQDNLAEKVRRLKQQPGRDLVLVCGPDLLAALLEHGLVDEVMLLIKPKALGQGKALFGAVQHKVSLTLLATRVFGSGTVLHHYQMA